MKWIAPHGAATSTERYINAQPTIAGSNPDAAFFNTVLDELLAVIVAADMTPTDENLHQIADAIVYLTERAATSGVTKGAFWFGKTTANFTVPNPTLPEQNYIDFTTLKTYSAKSNLSGWTQTGTFVPPVGIDFTILITSKFWDIPEQDDQQGGWAQYNHTDDEWSWWPKIINLDNAANLSLSNLNTNGKNIANWSSNVANCITNIPQDINLELNNGTLTLKSGSKLYVPNGSGTFDILTLTADKTATQTANDTRMYLYNGSYIEKFPPAQCYSGDTAPSGQTYMFWYDTANNLMKMTTNGGSTWTSGWSLPFCIATASSGALTSIDQVFNGFGYIGSTVFALPGVTLVKPDGRNTDGTLKNVISTITSVRTNTTYRPNTNGYLIYAPAGQAIQKSAASTNWYYDKNRNVVSSLSGDTSWMIWGEYTTDASDLITSFSPKTVFHAVDYNDFQTLGTSKANTSLDNVSAGIDFVVESQLPTAQNNYTWYRKYKSGWVEQGGYLPATGSGNTLQTVNLPKAMSDAHYTVTTSITDTTAGYAPDWYLVTVQQQTSTGFKTYTGSDWGKYWSVSGKALS